MVIKINGAECTEKKENECTAEYCEYAGDLCENRKNGLCRAQSCGKEIL